MGSIDAFYVERRIGLGIAELLGFLEHVLEGAALLSHLGENEIAGAVDDARQPVDAVAGKAFANRLDHRDTASHRSLERDDDALFARLGEDLVAVHCDQCLVRSDHMLAILDGLEHQFLGYRVAADQLDNDVDFRVVHDIEDVGGDRGRTGVALGIRVTSGNLRNLDSTPGTAGNLLGVAFEHIEGTATDGSQPTDANFHRFQAALPIPSETTGPADRQKSRTLRREQLLVNQPRLALRPSKPQSLMPLREGFVRVLGETAVPGLYMGLDPAGL